MHVSERVFLKKKKIIAGGAFVFAGRSMEECMLFLMRYHGRYSLDGDDDVSWCKQSRWMSLREGTNESDNFLRFVLIGGMCSRLSWEEGSIIYRSVIAHSELVWVDVGVDGMVFDRSAGP